MTRPYFSIIIPTYNRPAQLERCLQAMTRLAYPRDRFEVIVVNDGGERPLNELVTRFAETLTIRLIDQPNQGPATARNTGAAAAVGDYLAFTDDDCAPDADWLRYFAAGFGAETAFALGGHTVNKLTKNPYASTSQLLIDYLYTYYNQPDGTFFTSNNFAAPRQHFLQLGGFPAEMRLAAGEDRAFCDRWLFEGLRLNYVPEAIVHHRHRLTLRSFWRQHFHYGQGAWQFHRLRAQRRQQKVQVEPLTFYADLLRFPFSQKQGWAALGQAGLLIVAQLANAAGFFYARWQGKNA